jgi:hypothetical protein
MTSATFNAKGTSNTSFKIHKSGPTLYQGADPALVTDPKEGDLYVKVGDDSFTFQYQSGHWQETGKVKLGTQTLRGQNNVNVSSNEYVYYGKTVNSSAVRLSLDGAGSEFVIPLFTSGQYQISVIGSSLDHNHHVAMTVKGLYVNLVAGQGQVLGSAAQEVMYQTDEAMTADVVVTNTGLVSSFSIIVLGLPSTEIMWSAFIHTTTVTGIA